MTTLSAEATCYHCGESCGSTSEESNGLAFCCSGCKTVYEILKQGDLCQYYKLEDRLAQKTEAASSDKWDYLDTPEIFKERIVFEDETTVRVVFQTPKIHCSSCIWLLDHLPSIHEGILSSQVHFGRKEVDLLYKKDQLKLSELAHLLSQLGYPPHISMGSSKEPMAFEKSFYYKLGIAGFAFGNIMMLSLPEYLGMSLETHATYARFFGWINLFLAFPVVFYCSSDYFKAVFKSAKHKLITVDLPIAIGISTLFLRSAYDILSGTGAGYMDSLAGLVFFLLIGKWYQQKTFKALSFERDYQSYFPLAVTLIQKGEKPHSISIRDLSIGDRIQVRKGEIIPADGVLVEGDARIDYSFVTGEEKAVRKENGDVLFAGGRQTGAPIELMVTKNVEQSYLTKLWNQKAFRKPEHLELVGFINRISRYFTLAILLVAFGTWLYWFFVDNSVAWHAVTSVLIIACPCALALASPFALGNMMRRFAAKGMYLKNASVVENMASIDHLVFDKTGTLTHSGNNNIIYEGAPLSTEDRKAIATLASCSTHPHSQSILRWLDEDKSAQNISDFKEVSGQGISATIGNALIKLGNAEFVGEKSHQKSETNSFVSIQNVLKGRFIFHNMYRNNVLEAFKELRNHGSLSLLSGDSNNEKSNLLPYFLSDEYLLFDQSPNDKLQHIELIQNKGKKVMMIGDGLNDAGALKQSNVGIAVSENIQQFSPSCDAILAADNLPKLNNYLKAAKGTVRVIRWSLALSLMYNVIGLLFAVSGQLSPLIAAILMPISSVAVVSFVIIATNRLARKELD